MFTKQDSRVFCASFLFRNIIAIKNYLILSVLSVILLFFSAKTFAQPGAGIAAVNPPSGGFHIDGNLQANTPTSGIGDWLPGLAGAGGNVLNAAGIPINNGTTYHLIDLYNSGSDNNFAGGLKFDGNPNGWTWVSNPVGSKVDINNGLIHFTRDAIGHQWVIVAADRASNSGDAYIDFEFLQNTVTTTGTTSGAFVSAGPNGGRTLNDFALTLLLTKGGASAGFFVNRWQAVVGGFDYVDRTSAIPAGSVYASVNTATSPVSFGAFGLTSYPTNTFAEAAVDLTALLSTFNPCTELGIKTILIKTKESSSPSATIVDFMAPLQVSLVLGVADAGPDKSQCSSNFNLTGSATPAPGSNVTSTTWSVVGGAATITNGNTLTPTVNVTSSPATLRLTVATSPNGCSATDDVVLTVLPSPPANAGADVTVNCTTPSATLTATGGGSYSWSPGGATTASITVTPASTTTYTVTVTGANGCSATDDVKVTVDKTPPTANAGADVTVNCTTPSATLTATGGGSYSWSTGATTASITVSPASTTTYTVTVTAANGCTASDAVTVTADNQPPSITSICVVQPTICSKGSITINASGGSGIQYSIDGSTFQSSPDFNNLITGDVKGIYIINAAGCAPSAPVNCADIASSCAGTTINTIKTSGTVVLSDAVAPAQKEKGVINSEGLKVKAFPNPFLKTINFQFTSPLSGKAIMELFDITGKKIAVVYEGMVKAGATNTVRYNAYGSAAGMMIYNLKVEGKTVRGKIEQMQ